MSFVLMFNVLSHMNLVHGKFQLNLTFAFD